MRRPRPIKQPRFKAEVLGERWWPQREGALVGIAAGASTPDTRIGEVLLRLAEFAGCPPQRMQELRDASPEAAPVY